MFGLAMDDATERTFGRQLERFPDPLQAVTPDIDRCTSVSWRM